jgi:hypothetical protein
MPSSLGGVLGIPAGVEDLALKFVEEEKRLD